MSSLFERYRPKCWDEVVGQERAVKMLKRSKPGGKAFWFAAGSGTGKTTLARILAAEIAESWHVEELDAQDCNLELLRRMEVDMAYKGMGAKQGKAWIINEAHGLRGPILSRFLTLIEQLPAHCTVIFTTTFKGQQSLFAEMDDANPFLSRCLVVPMAYHELSWTNGNDVLTQAVAKKARAIAQAEKLDGKPLEEYVKLALECKDNLRMVLSRIESGCMMEDCQ